MGCLWRDNTPFNVLMKVTHQQRSALLLFLLLFHPDGTDFLKDLGVLCPLVLAVQSIESTSTDFAVAGSSRMDGNCNVMLYIQKDSRPSVSRSTVTLSCRVFWLQWRRQRRRKGGGAGGISTAHRNYQGVRSTEKRKWPLDSLKFEQSLL